MADMAGMADELRTPDQWCTLTGRVIIDPDGWRGPNGRPYSDPVTRDEFERRALASTQMRGPRPTFGRANGADGADGAADLGPMPPREAVRPGIVEFDDNGGIRGQVHPDDARVYMRGVMDGKTMACRDILRQLPEPPPADVEGQRVFVSVLEVRALVIELMAADIEGEHHELGPMKGSEL